jgi:hypothetical protein
MAEKRTWRDLRLRVGVSFRWPVGAGSEPLVPAGQPRLA